MAFLVGMTPIRSYLQSPFNIAASIRDLYKTLLAQLRFEARDATTFHIAFRFFVCNEHAVNSAFVREPCITFYVGVMTY